MPLPVSANNTKTNESTWKNIDFWNLMKTPEEPGTIFHGINTKQQVLILLTYFEMLPTHYFENNILLIDTDTKNWLFWIKIPFMFSSPCKLLCSLQNQLRSSSLSNFANNFWVCKKILFTTVQYTQKSQVLSTLQCSACLDRVLINN